MKSFTYIAFISYKREDKLWAHWLHRKLEHYKLPSSIRKADTSLPEHVRPVFRDMTDLEPGILSENIRKGLEQSRYLIVICSPRSAKSEYVNYEIEEFIRQGKKQSIIPFIVEGEPHAADPGQACFPPALHTLDTEQELLGVNIHEMGRRAATLKVISRMFGLRFDVLWKRHEREQRLRHWFAFATILLIALVGFGIAMSFKTKNTKLLINQSRAVASVAERLIEEGDLYTAQRLCIEVLPKNLKHPDRPYLPEVERILRNSIELSTKELHPIAVLRNHTDAIRCIDISPEGKHIISSSQDGSIRIWDIKTGAELFHIILPPFRNPITFVQFSPDEKKLAFLYPIRYVLSAYVVNIENGEISKIHTLGNSTSVHFSPDSKKIVAGSRTITPEWKPEKGEQTITFCIYDIETGDILQKFEKHNDVVWNAKFSPDGKRVISGSEDCTARIWDIETGDELKTLRGHTDAVGPVSYSSDGKWILSSSRDKTIRLWHAETGKEIKKLEGHKDIVTMATFSPDGKQIASASTDGTIRIWDVDTGNEICTLNGHKRSVESIAFSPDGKRIISGSTDHTIRIWTTNNIKGVNTSTDITCAEEKKSIAHVRDFANFDHELHNRITDFNEKISPDEKSYLICSRDGRIRIYNIDTHAEIQVLGEVGEGLISANFSPSGKLIVSSTMNSVHVWNVTNGHELQKFDIESDSVSVHFSKDELKIIGKQKDSIIYIWDFPPLQELIDQTRERFKNRPLTDDEREQYYLQ